MENLKIIVFDEEELTRTLIESYLQDLTFPYSFEKYNEFDEHFIDFSTDENKVIIINVNKYNSDILNKIADLRSYKNNFIVISYDKSANLSVKAFRNGAKDFLLKPLIKSDFLYAVQTIYKKTVSSEINNKKSKIYTASSYDKGEGKSTFLINLAKETADISKEKVLLLDFNDFPDNIKSILDTDISLNTNDFIKTFEERKNEDIISKIPAYNNSSLYVITSGFQEIGNKKYSDESVVKIINMLKQHFKYIFIDKNIDNSDLKMKIDAVSDIIFFVINTNSANIEKMKNNLNNYDERKLIFVCNKYEEKEEIKLEKIKSAAEKEIKIKIPKNIISMNTALREHKTLKEIEPELDIVGVYSEIANYIIKRD